MEEKSLKNILDQYLERLPNSYKLLESKIVNVWQKTMPKTITSRTKKIFIKNDILFIKFSSAPLKDEINMRHEELLMTLKKQVPLKDKINKLVAIN